MALALADHVKTPPTTTTSRAAEVRTLLRRHWPAVVVIAAGVLLRILVMIAYPRGFWIQGDSQEYLGTAFSHVAGYIRPSGYAIFLTALVPFGSTAVILVIQHLLGVGVAVLSYVFLQRRAVNRYVAAVAIAPMLLESRLITLEHYLLAETFFIALAMAALIILLWRDKPGVRRLVLVGLLLAVASVTRSVAITIIPVVVLYLAIRRIGWRQIAAFGLAIFLGIGLYAAWFDASHDEWGLTGYSGRFLWARTTTFMDCAKLDLTPDEAKICPKEPIGQRPNPDHYLWAQTSVSKYNSPAGDQIHAALAKKAILGQPLDYLAVIVKGTWSLMPPGVPTHTSICDYEQYLFPTADAGPTCRARYLAPPNPWTRHWVGDVTWLSGPLLTPLNAYSRVMILPGGVSGLAFLFALVAAFVRPRRSRLRDWLDPLLFSGLAFGMIVLSVAAALPDTRYEAPSLPLAMIGAALAWTRLRAVTKKEAPAQ